MVKDIYKALQKWAKGTLEVFIFAEARIKNVFLKKETNRLVLIKVDAIGDFILFSTFIRAYADLYKGYRISLVVNVMCLELAKKICAPIPQVDKVIPFDRNKFDSSYLYKINIFRSLRGENGSVAIQPTLSRNYVGDVLTKMTDAPERIGYEREPGTISPEQKMIDDTFYTRLITIDEKAHSEIANDTHFLIQLGGNIRDTLPHLEVTIKEEQGAQKILAGHGLPANKKYVLIQPGAGSTFRQWPISRFVEVMKYLIRERGLSCVITGSPREKELSISLREEMGEDKENVINLVGETSLIQLAAIAKGAVLYFGNETGTLHISAAVGTPTLCIMGGGHFGRFFPYGDPEKNRIVYDADMKCRNDNWNCSRKLKPGAIAPCIDAITVEDVLGALRAMK